ncbi:MAG: hypothetical protein OEY94_02020 [Alphaproteobacteria bacterium]|nr:hypothetical protein [Alphaproteobacteria bacterium]
MGKSINIKSILKRALNAKSDDAKFYAWEALLEKVRENADSAWEALGELQGIEDEEASKIIGLIGLQYGRGFAVEALKILAKRQDDVSTEWIGNIGCSHGKKYALDDIGTKILVDDVGEYALDAVDILKDRKSIVATHQLGYIAYSHEGKYALAVLRIFKDRMEDEDTREIGYIAEDGRLTHGIKVVIEALKILDERDGKVAKETIDKIEKIFPELKDRVKPRSIAEIPHLGFA